MAGVCEHPSSIGWVPNSHADGAPWHVGCGHVVNDYHLALAGSQTRMLMAHHGALVVVTLSTTSVKSSELGVVDKETVGCGSKHWLTAATDCLMPEVVGMCFPI
ncbi:unnamed protein product [Ostreobium quekettii]|uniref:Uncharacterized protein n=1 Tax=Ostreobium quekettii TaxID=121088 RepID=A0A8S1IT36_9CHLO|nr:unnamed protein product [Ostreobium quekettii]